MKNDALMTLAQASGALGITTSTLRVQVWRKKLKATKFGTTWVVTSAEVERYRKESLGKGSVAK